MEERKKDMKRLVGGDFLLDMSPIELEVSVDGVTKTAITDNEVLGQLTNLKSYIGKPSMIKPIWCKLTNGETDELIVAKGTLAVVDESEFEINIPLKGFLLTIAVAFTQMLNEDEEPIDDWYIDEDDAEYILVSDAQAIGSIEELPIFENIVDKDGHKRFVEGSVNFPTAEGLTKTYGKWSLSGSHLMIVLGFSAENTTQILNAQQLGSLQLPEWIHNKLSPLFSTYVDIKSFYMRASNWTTQSINVSLGKGSNNYLFIYSLSTLTMDADRNVRIQFDFLIDNEETPAP